RVLNRRLETFSPSARILSPLPGEIPSASKLMKRVFLTPICFFLAWSTLAFAQAPTELPTIERQVKGKPETNINAGIFATIKNDCTAGPLPAVRLVNPPVHGKVIVKQG